MEARREARARAAAAAEVRKTPEAMSALRAAFLKKVESYIGVPYGRKYHADNPSSPHHEAELYLDCCALVRRGGAVYNLHPVHPQLESAWFGDPTLEPET
jgi:hypothetical protein